MANMSYCQFNNTALDLEQCLDTLQSIYDGDERRPSNQEIVAAKQLAATALEFIGMIADALGMTLEDIIDSTNSDKLLASGIDKIITRAKED